MADEMRLLVRPVRGAVVGGVAAAIAERFELNIILLRLVFLAAMNASEISIALYVLLWLSIPNLRGVVGLIQFRSVPGEPLQFSDRVARVMQTLGIKKGVTSAGATVPIGLSILLFAVCLEFTKLTPADPFRTAPFVGVIAGILARLSSAIFYGSCGLLLFFRTRVDTQEPRLLQNIKPRLQLDTSERRALFGLISGVGAELGIDAALLRPLAILANIFTLGGAGAVYLATALILRRKDKSSLPDDVWPAEDSEHEPFSFPLIVSRIIGILFVLLAVVRLVTEYRLFFFNEAFAVGAGLGAIGITTAVCSLNAFSYSSTARMLLITGTAIFLYGLYELLTVLYYVQLPFSARFELAFAIAGLSFIYYGLTAAGLNRTKLAFVLGVMFFAAALSFQFNLLSSRFVLAIVEFYLYFYPILFGTAGLWLIIGANGGKTFRHLPKWLEISERRTMNLPDRPQPQ